LDTFFAPMFENLPDQPVEATKSASKIEIAKILRQVRAVATSQQYRSIVYALAGRPAEAIDRAVAGLSEEDEFVLLCLLMETATHIAPLDQTPSAAAGLGAPDLLIRFQPGFAAKGIPSSRHRGYRCLVEVKSTTKREFHMSGGALQRLRSFADAFNLPLLFAVRFLEFRSMALWVMVEDVDRSKRSLTVSVEDWIRTLRPVLWNEYAYTLMPGTHFQAIYSAGLKGQGIQHPDYGEQVAFRVVTRQGPKEVAGVDSVLVSAFFECYKLVETNVKRDEESVYVSYRPTTATLSIADLIHGMNRLPTDPDGRRIYDAGRIIHDLVERRQTSLVSRKLVEALGDTMCDIGALTIGVYEHPADSLRRWLATGGDQQ